MFTIKFNAIDTGAKIVYCGIRNIEEGKKSPPIERTFPYAKFIEVEPRLAEMLIDDIYSIYLEDSYTEKKYIDGSITKLSDDEISYCQTLVHRACRNLEFENLLVPPSIDDQIDSFIKEFFSEEEEPAVQKDFLAEFFSELDSQETKDTNTTTEQSNNTV